MNSKNQNLFAKVREIVAFGIVCMLLFLIAGSFSSCDRKAIPFMEFSLFEINCRWINTELNSVIIINCSEMLKKHIECANDNYPDIDFSKHTLLLASGSTNSGIHRVNVGRVQQLSTNTYRLNIQVALNESTMIDTWIVALIVNKLSSQSEIELNVNIRN